MRNPESHSIAGPLPPPVTWTVPARGSDRGRRRDQRHRRHVSGASVDPFEPIAVSRPTAAKQGP